MPHLRWLTRVFGITPVIRWMAGRIPKGIPPWRKNWCRIYCCLMNPNPSNVPFASAYLQVKLPLNLGVNRLLNGT